MTTYYVDPVNGNDANDGLSWATAYKTLLNGPTFARMGQTDSDEVRIAKSPDPISIGNVEWTNGSPTLTVSTLSNVTVDNCETAWSAGLVTPTTTTAYFREGARSVACTLTSTNGKVGYKTLPSTNYSAFTRLTFWVNFGTAVNFSTSNPFTLSLCSDTTGDTAVVTFRLPRYYYPPNYWVPITITPESGLMSNATAIQSIALRTTAAVTNTIRIDNISLAKDSSDATALVLTDLIAKDNGKGEYYPILYIDGTTVGIAGHQGANTAAVTATQNYYSFNGTETVNTLKRECFNTALDIVATASSSAINAFNYTNIANWPATKTYIGGVNPATNLVDGETWFDGITRYGHGLTQSNSADASWNVSNVSAVRYYIGLYTDVGYDMEYNNISITACDRYLHVDSIPLIGTYTTTRPRKAVKANINFKWVYTNNTTTAAMQVISNADYIGRMIGVIPVCTIGNIRTTSPSSTYGSVVYVPGTQIFDFVVTGDIIAHSTVFTGIGPGARITVNNIGWTGINTFTLLVGASSGRRTSPAYITTLGAIRYLGSGANYVQYVGGTQGVPIDWTFGPDCVINLSDTRSGGVYFLTSTATCDTTFRNFKYVRPAGTGSLLVGTTISQDTHAVFENFNNSGEVRVYSNGVGFFEGGGTTKGIYWTNQTATTYTGTSAWQAVYQQNWYYADNTYDTNRLPVGDIAVKGGTAVTITVRCFRAADPGGNPAGVNGYITLRGDGINAPSYTESTTTTQTGTWELLTATVTPTGNTVLKVDLCTQGAVPANIPVYVTFDDLQVTQA